jgi:hypothetical protein
MTTRKKEVEIIEVQDEGENLAGDDGTEEDGKPKAAVYCESWPSSHGDDTGWGFDWLSTRRSR